MGIIYNRRDFGYTIISRFEAVFREALVDKLTARYQDYKEGVPIGIINKINERSNILFWEDPIEFFDNSDFPDLLEICLYKNHLKDFFPNLAFNKAEFQTTMSTIYSLRCKIAHIKGFFTSFDLDKLIDCCKQLVHHIDIHGNLINLIIDLERNPEKVAIKVPIDFTIDFFESNGIINNLPIPDFEYEGGFVGRDDDIRDIIKYLDSNKFLVITITGAGGVGKTSLALKVVQEITQKYSERKFDTIIWLSAKENKLSPFGIEDIEPTFKSYEDLLNTIIEVIGFSTDDQSSNYEEKEKLALKLLELPDSPLIIIDNLETVSDQRIINFIIDAPSNIKFLITSRKGLGQVERRYELRELKEKEAIFLFRQIAKDKQLPSLVKLEDIVIKKYVNKVSNYPLAIKWVLGQVARGKDINRVIDTIDDASGDISKFCFEQIFAMLSEDSKNILYALCCFEEPPTSSLLRYVVEIDTSKFDDSIEELIQVSLVVPEQFKNEQNEIATKYFILPLTKGFVRQQLNQKQEVKSKLLQRISSVENTITASEQAKREYRFSLNNLGATTEEEKISAIFVQTALHKHQSGHYSEAVENYKKAVEIAPKFSSAYRNWAVMESLEEHLYEADQLMQKASELKDDDPQIWLLWGNIKRKSNKISSADEKYEKAYKLSPEDNIILNAYGQTRSRLGDFEFALELLTKATEKESNKSSKKHEIINRTSMAESLISWSEVLIRDRNLNIAQEKLFSALEECKKTIVIDKSDSKTTGMYSKTLYKIGKYFENTDDVEQSKLYYRQCLSSGFHGFKAIRYKIKSGINIAKIYLKDDETEEMINILSPFLTGSEAVLRKFPELLHEINHLLEKAGRFNSYLDGEICHVNPLKEYVLLCQIGDRERTYIAGKYDFYPVLSTISRDLHKLKVRFLPKEYYSNGIEKKEAKKIVIIGY